MAGIWECSVSSEVACGIISGIAFIERNRIHVMHTPKVLEAMSHVVSMIHMPDMAQVIIIFKKLINNEMK